jgi:hypothetical protein
MMIGKIGKIFWISLVGLFLAEGLSLWGWHQPGIGKIIFAIIVVGTFLLASWRLELGVWIVLAELIVGSKGYLFVWPLGNFNISIRLAIFGIVILAWLVHRIRQRNWPFWQAKSFRSYLGLIVYIIIGIILGIMYRNKPADIFYDANGYLYLGLLPVAFDALRTRASIANIFQVIWASIVAVGLKTLVLLFLFAGQFDFLVQVYRWVRDTRVNEITLIAGNAYRIFSQSQVFGLFGFFIALAVTTLIKPPWAQVRWWRFFLWISGTIVIISYSRSFWLALLATATIWLVYLWRRRDRTKKTFFKHVAYLMLILVGELVAILFIIRLPNLINLNRNTASFSSLVEDRLTNEEQAGLQSRWNLISPMTKKIIRQPVVGHGFGSTVTYQSNDPRIKLTNNGGIYTTYSFEWGYLDILLKLGLVGLFIYGYFVYRIFRLGQTALKYSPENKPLVIGLLLALSALILTHLTTPYLNHPLGLGLIIICVVVFEQLNHAQLPPTENHR